MRDVVSRSDSDEKYALNSYDRQEDESRIWKPIVSRIFNADTSSNNNRRLQESSVLSKLRNLRVLQNGLDYARYTYYINRKGTLDDLGLFIAANVALFTALALTRASISGDTLFWDSLYSTYKLVFGEFDDDVIFPLQVFSLCVATIGFLAFALVLALVEQAFLEGLDENVRVGSQVLETGHFLLLAFGRSPRDREMLLTVTRQICHAYKDVGGTTIVVLTETPKLEIQRWFMTMLEDEAHGSKLVFRQGNPLTMPDLQNVNAYYAASTVILGDQSRGPVEADAQSVRVAVLLDELQAPDDGIRRHREGHIICEVYNQDTVEVVTYACSSRVIPVATARLNARRLVRMLRQPIAGLTTRRLWDFSSDSRVAMEEHPELEGELFEEVMLRFPTCTPMGVINGSSIILCPDQDYRIHAGDELVMLRQSGSSLIRPTPKPMPVARDEWHPRMSASDFARMPQETKMVATESCCDAELDGVCLQFADFCRSDWSDVQSGVFMHSGLDAETEAPPRASEEPLHVLICGWKTRQFMCALCRELDRGRTQLPRGSHVTFFNEHPPETLDSVEDTVRLHNVTATHVHGSALMRRDVQKLDVTSVDIAMVLCDERWLDPDQDMANGYDDITTPGDLLRLEAVACPPPWSPPHPSPPPRPTLSSAVHATQPSNTAPPPSHPHTYCLHLHLHLCTADRQSARCMPPASYIASAPVSCLPIIHCTAVIPGQQGLCVPSPCPCSPRRDGGLQPGYGMQVLAAQLNVRMRLERASRPLVSVVAEKMAYGSQTRFEDFTQLPVGISVNFTSFSSKMLAFVAHYPKLLVPYFSIGDTADVQVFDSSWICGVGEALSYAALQSRCFRLQQMLVGFYELPSASDEPLQLVVNPQGFSARTEKRIWNVGNGHVKLLALTRVPDKPSNPLINQLQKKDFDNASEDEAVLK